MMTIAIMINIMPIHCKATTCSFNIINAIITETGSSNEDTILPKPSPVWGKPAFISRGGIIVPKRAKKIP